MDKQKAIDEFLKALYKSNENQIEGDSAAVELFSGESPFRIVCAKCGSAKVGICGDSGYMGSSYTGWISGTTVVKCSGCGAAMTVYD